ncbi:MAG: efflux RND transporter permease subunit, partial [Verrucomicrobiota bacterium]
LMAIPFRSYIQPLIIMSVIPFSLIGAAGGHIIMGMPLSMLSVCGIIALAGVVVNDGLVLVDYINSRRRMGLPLRMSVLIAGKARFRAILLTSLTTFFGLLPLLTERSTQAQFLKPMAVSLAFGVMFATMLNLILVPALYTILEDIKGAALKTYRKVTI